MFRENNDDTVIFSKSRDKNSVTGCKLNVENSIEIYQVRLSSVAH